MTAPDHPERVDFDEERIPLAYVSAFRFDWPDAIGQQVVEDPYYPTPRRLYLGPICIGDCAR